MFINLFNGFKLLEIKTHFIMGQTKLNSTDLTTAKVNVNIRVTKF